MKTSKPAITTAITLALTASLGSAGIAYAGEHPFAMQVLAQGYQVADAKMPEGKCGATKAEEGKCAANKAEDGKCGANKVAPTKAKDGKCGEGKCGANKSKPAEGNPE